MTTGLESDLRRGLHQLADAPAPPGMADIALAGAQRVRRRRGVLGVVGVMALAGAIAVPWLAGGDSQADVRSGAPRAIAPVVTPTGACKTATDEAEPPEGAPRDTWPDFVPVVIGKLPPRSDYTVQWAYGMCQEFEGTPLPARTAIAYAVINLGPNREHGHLTIDFYRDSVIFDGITCATLASPHPQSPFQDLLHCQDATSDTPMVVAYGDGSRQLGVTAIYSDGRAIMMEATGTPFDVEALRVVVNDPELAALVS